VTPPIIRLLTPTGSAVTMGTVNPIVRELS